MSTKKNTLQNPFLEGKFEDLFSQFKVPGVEFDEILKSHTKNIEALTTANQLAVEGLQTAFQRQTEMLQQVLQDTTTIAKELLAEGTPEEKAIAHTERVQKAFETTLSNLKELGDIVANANQEAANIISKRVAESLTEVKKSIEKNAKKKAA